MLQVYVEVARVPRRCATIHRSICILVRNNAAFPRPRNSRRRPGPRQITVKRGRSLNRRPADRYTFYDCQVSNKGLKIIQTVHPGGSTRSAVKHLVPGHAVLAAVQREDVVAATLLLPNPATNNPVHVHAYRLLDNHNLFSFSSLFYLLYPRRMSARIIQQRWTRFNGKTGMANAPRFETLTVLLRGENVVFFFFFRLDEAGISLVVNFIREK